MTAEELVFLEVDDVIELHPAQLEVFGGGSGLFSLTRSRVASDLVSTKPGPTPRQAVALVSDIAILFPHVAPPHS